MTTYARLTERSAPLFGDNSFGLTYATKLFGPEAIASLPRYTRGPKKGQIKAWVVWKKADSGGWTHDYGVVYPGLVWAKIVGSPYDTIPLRGQWCGAVQSLSGHRDTLTVEWRERDLTDRRDAMAQFEARLAAQV